MDTVLSPPLVTTRSGLPVPVRSWRRSEVGPMPTLSRSFELNLVQASSSFTPSKTNTSLESWSATSSSGPCPSPAGRTAAATGAFPTGKPAPL